MPHLHTKPGHHDATASAFIIRLEGKEPRVMLHQHKKLGVYLQFGGHVEWHENPWQAITHELEEESGYSMEQLKILQPKIRIKHLKGVLLHPVPIHFMTHPFPGMNHYHTDTAFAFTTNELPANSIAEGESAIMKLFTLKQLRELPSGQIPENVRDTGIFALETVLHEWEAVDTSLYN